MLFLFCNNCGIQNPDEAIFCIRCGKQFTSTKHNLDLTYVIAGIATAIISLAFLPPVFGIVSMTCGYKLHKQGSDVWGIGIFMLGLVSMFIGLFIGFITAVSYL